MLENDKAEKNPAGIRFVPLYVSIGLFAVGVVLFATMGKWKTLKLTLPVKDVADLLASLVLAVAFIERRLKWSSARGAIPMPTSLRRPRTELGSIPS